MFVDGIQKQTDLDPRFLSLAVVSRTGVLMSDHVQSAFGGHFFTLFPEPGSPGPAASRWRFPDLWYTSHFQVQLDRRGFFQQPQISFLDMPGGPHEGAP